MKTQTDEQTLKHSPLNEYYVDLGMMTFYYSKENMERAYEERYEGTEFDWKVQLEKAHITKMAPVEAFNNNPKLEALNAELIKQLGNILIFVPTENTAVIQETIKLIKRAKGGV